jgi:MscS family membrane protein
MMNHIYARIVTYCLVNLLFASYSWGANHPLEPPDISSPHATLRSFLKYSDRFATSMPDADSNSRETAEALEGAVYCLDLSEVAPSHAKDVGIESVLLLREILDRLVLPDLEDVPDERDMKQLGLGQWSIPHTEITIAKVPDGSTTGAFLFNAQTIDRLGGYYAKVKDLPYQDGAVKGIYETYMHSSGWLYPEALISKLPKWMMSVYKGQAVWKWIELVTTLLVGFVIIVLTIRGSRLWTKQNTDKTWRFKILFFPLMAMCACLTMERLVDRQINITGEVLTFVTMLLEVCSLLFLAWGILILGNLFTHGIVTRKQIKEEAINADFIKLAFQLISLGLVVLLFYRAGSYFGLPVTAVFASAGIVGIAVALAAKETLSNFFGGVSILMDRPFKAGDYIVLDTGERGMVKAVGMRSTRLLTRDDVLITIPNSIITNVKIVNQSAPYPHFRVHIKIGVAYGSDLEQVEQILVNVAEANPLVMKEPAPRARLRTFNDSSIDFELLVWAKRPQDRGKITHEINKQIYLHFADEEVNIPFPQRVVHVVGEAQQSQDMSLEENNT